MMTFEELQSSPESLSELATPPSDRSTPKGLMDSASRPPAATPLPPLLRNLFSADALSSSPEVALQEAPASVSEGESGPSPTVSLPEVLSNEYSESFCSESVMSEMSACSTGYAEATAPRTQPVSDSASPTVCASPRPLPPKQTLFPPSPPSAFEYTEFAARAPIAVRVLDRDALDLLSAYDASVLAMTQALRHEIDFVRQVSPQTSCL